MSVLHELPGPAPLPRSSGYPACSWTHGLVFRNMLYTVRVVSATVSSSACAQYSGSASRLWASLPIHVLCSTPRSHFHVTLSGKLPGELRGSQRHPIVHLRLPPRPGCRSLSGNDLSGTLPPRLFDAFPSLEEIDVRRLPGLGLDAGGSSAVQHLLAC